MNIAESKGSSFARTSNNWNKWRWYAGATVLLLLFLPFESVHADDQSFLSKEDTWANWERRWDDAFKNIPSRSLPGRTMGLIVPSDSRDDILPLSAFGYEVLARGSFHTAVILLRAPADYPADGLVAPGIPSLETPFGRFPVDTVLRDQLTGPGKGVSVDPNLFVNDMPKILTRQLAALKYVLKKDVVSMRVLPLYVKLSDVNSQAKDLAPFLVDRIRDYGVDSDVVFLILSNLSRTNSDDKLIQTDAPVLKAIRELNVDELLNMKQEDVIHEDFGVLLLGVLTMRWMGSDHADIFAYSHSGQLVLTKDKKTPLSYIAGGFASKPPIFSKVAHVEQEKMADTFGELLRSDLLALARQTLLSTIDPTAAKPPAVNNPQAGKKWPVYVSIFDAQGKLAGQAGSHVATGPLEESIRKYTFDAVRRAQPDLTKANANAYVVEISIPYGFEKINQPDDYIPLLNGVVVEQKLKTQAMHPDIWRTYPDPHQMLSTISTRLGGDPWTYATSAAKLDSFRVLSFNEKEPFQQLGSTKKKKKKSADGLEEDLGGGGGGGGAGGSPFGF